MPTLFPAYPDVSPPLAARLRAAYLRLRDARRGLAWHEAKVNFLIWYIEHYESDSERFAKLNYPGHGADSYPVQTHMERKREALERSIEERLPHYQALVPVVEAATLVVEDEVRVGMVRVRPTSKREPWPPRPRSLEACRKEAWNSPEHKTTGVLKREEQSEARQKAKAESTEKARLDFEKEFEEMLRDAQFRMSPTKFAVHKDVMLGFKRLHDARQLDVFAIAAGDLRSIKCVIESAQQVATEQIEAVLPAHDNKEP